MDNKALGSDNLTLFRQVIDLLQRGDDRAAIHRRLHRVEAHLVTKAVFPTRLTIISEVLSEKMKGEFRRSLANDLLRHAVPNLAEALGADPKGRLEFTHDGWNIVLEVGVYTHEGKIVNPLEWPEGTPLGREMSLVITRAA